MRDEGFPEAFERIASTIETAVQGKPDQVRLAVTCLLAGGHLLIEDLPGVGKTLLARCLAASVQASMKRIQFTPDLLPSDITGTDIYRPRSNEREFMPGPVFAHVVLADEINRATPRAQSALLEAMEEHHVTVGGVTHPLPEMFLVVATQNPVDMDGTYPLPEAQLDRFLMRIRMGYPDFAAEKRVLAAKVATVPGGGAVAEHGRPDENGRVAGHQARAGSEPAYDPLAPDRAWLPRDGQWSDHRREARPVTAATSEAEVLALRGIARRTTVKDPVYDYLLRITRATRRLVAGQSDDPDPRSGRNGWARPAVAPSVGSLVLGASPRASVGLLHAAQVRARVAGRDSVYPEDIKPLAVPVLAHRLSLSSAAVLAGRNAEDIVEEVLAAVAVPR
ncbi:AAA family ATPase [Frankia nepalensis]|uniref:AAA family ATPase n=1 Tax=Frankia nepalensis TaxID=1836974 RepID=UPI0027DBDA1A|nr:AAA family ATPase [Frankia nepalensis]